MRYYLTTEVFLITRGHRYILYAPLQRLIIEITPGAADLVKQIQDGVELTDLTVDRQKTIGLLQGTGLISQDIEVPRSHPPANILVSC